MTTKLALRAALALYPREWRRRFGAELESLVIDTRPSARVLVDLVRGALLEHHRLRPALFLWIGTFTLSSVADVVALRTGATANILWAPTNAYRGTLLAITVVPTLGAAAATVRRRRMPAVS